MTTADGLIAELKHEAAQTRRLLERLPDDRLDFRPHARSFTLGELASHLTSLIGWTGPTCAMDHFVFNKEEWPSWVGHSAATITARLDEQVEMAIRAIQPLSDADMAKVWTMAGPDGTVFLSMPRLQVLRTMILNHLIHHRGQLTVYLRLCDVSLPAIYGPSADESF